MADQFETTDTGNGNPPPKKPPVENPAQQPNQPTKVEGIGGA